MNKLTTLTAALCLAFMTGCSGQQVADAAIGVAKVPFKVVGAAATAAATTAGTVAGTAAAGPLGGAIGGAVGGAIVGAVVN
ncbi:MAG: hypothetical protein CSB47_08935 [Proteobacteria bacterium]|nr:MAG: hypothetical protein CSB47_08935 [Pseudomonadota bacterium]